MNELDNWLAQLQDTDPRKRAEAARKLGDLGDTQAIEAIMVAAQDNHILVARTAVLALGKIGGCIVVEPLVTLLEHDNLWLRKAAVQALGIAKCEDAAPILVNMLADKDLFMLAREALIALKVNPDFF
jgi:HEAT repeat-containing taxis protein